MNINDTTKAGQRLPEILIDLPQKVLGLRLDTVAGFFERGNRLSELVRSYKEPAGQSLGTYEQSQLIGGFHGRKCLTLTVKTVRRFILERPDIKSNTHCSDFESK